MFYHDKEGGRGNHKLVTRIKGDAGSEFGNSLEFSVSVATSDNANRLMVGSPWWSDDYTRASFVCSLFHKQVLLQRMDSNKAMIEMTTNNSIRVNALLFDLTIVFSSVINSLNLSNTPNQNPYTSTIAYYTLLSRQSARKK